METLDLPVALTSRVSGPITVQSGSAQVVDEDTIRVGDENGVGGASVVSSRGGVEKTEILVDMVDVPVVEVDVEGVEVKVSGKKGRKKILRNDGKTDGGVVSQVKENGVERMTRSAKKNGGDVSIGKSRSSERVKERRNAVPEKEKEEVVEEEEEKEEEEEGEKEEEEKEEEDEEDMGEEEEEEHGFSDGDLVWGKIKSHPWWPGQIFSSSDASATAAKHKRRNRLLVAYFGDGTFAWCYPSQLKPFRENFDQLAKQSSSKSFVKAVNEAVDEIGRRIDSEMACSCIAVEHRPVKPLVSNAGIKEGVVRPSDGLGNLSIAEFDPAEFLRQLKYIAQVGSTNDMLHLLVIQVRLSGFYRKKGYIYLPGYHEPVGIAVAEADGAAGNRLTNEDIVEDHTEDVKISPVEADLPSMPERTEVGSTSITISRRGAGNSEDKLFQTKRQRSIAELLAGDTNSKDDKTSGHSLVEDGTMSPKARGKAKKRREEMGSEVGNDSPRAEELSMSIKRTRPSRTLKEDKDPKVTDGNGVAEETDVSAKTKTRRKSIGTDVNKDDTTEEIASNKTGFTPRKRRKNKGADGGKTDDVAEENKIKDTGGENTTDMAEKLTASGKKSKRKQEIQESKVGNENSVAKSKRRRNREAEGGTSDDVVEEHKIKDARGENSADMAEKSTPLGKRSMPRQDMLESKVGNENSVAKEPVMQSRGRKKSKNLEGGNDIAEKSSPANQTTESRKRKRNQVSELGVDNVIGDEGASGSKQVSSSKKLKKSKATGLDVTGEIKESNVGHDDITISCIVEDAIKMRKLNKPTGLSITVENKAPGFDIHETPTNEGGSSGSSLRERKKSKYLSPPYTTNIAKKSKNATSTNDSKKEDTNPKQESITTAEGRSGIKPVLEKCSGEAIHKDLTVLEESNTSAHEMLSDFRSAALDPLNLSKKQSDDTMKGFFTKFKSSLCENGLDVADKGSTKRVSFETKLNTPEGESKKKKQKLVSGSEGESNGEVSMASLLLTFSSGVSLPSKADIIKTMSHFGDIEESETEIKDNYAQVVYARSSDAKEAYTNFEEIRGVCSFGSSVISHRLRYLSTNSRPSPRKPSEVPLQVVKQSLSAATSVLEKSWSKLSSEAKTNLDGEIKDMLKKVTSIIESSSSS